MESFYFLVPIALIFVAIALRFLFWALNSGQYDNLDTEAHRILFDEDPAPEAEKKVAGAPVQTGLSEQTDFSEQADFSEQTGAVENTQATPASSKERSHD